MKKTSKYKALYQMSRQHKAKQPQIIKNVQDSLDNICNYPNQKLTQKKIKNHKKVSHMRSQSCPFMNSLKNQKIINHKNTSNQQNKRTLKKTSMKHYMHKKSKKNNHKYINSHASQDSSTTIFHNIPIQQLSSMLYSRNVGKDKNLKKSQSSINIQSSVSQTNLFSCLRTQTDVYFQTKLQQQMKIYQLNSDLQNLQKQAYNVKVKQKVLQALAGKFQYTEKDAYETVVIH